MDEKGRKISQRIWRYLKNLIKALFGLDPYRDELEDAREKMQKSADNLSAMRNQLYVALDRWDSALARYEEAEKRAMSLQVLTENLRQRIADKDKLIKELENELNKK